MGSEMFRRALIPLTDSRRILLDPALPQQQQYTDSFGFEWTKIDGFVGKEVMSHGHLFGRFLLPVEFFKGKNSDKIKNFGLCECEELTRCHLLQEQE